MMAKTPDIAANTAHMCGIVILTSGHLQEHRSRNRSYSLEIRRVLNRMIKLFNMAGNLNKCSKHLLGRVFVKLKK